MKRNIVSSSEEIWIYLIPTILGEFIFNKVYMNPIEILVFHNLSVPIYGLTLSFFLKFIIFDLPVCGTAIHLFITKKYYGFPFPEFLCPFFAILTSMNIILVVCNFSYSLFYSGDIVRFFIYIKDLLFLFPKNPTGAILHPFMNMDLSAFLPITPFVILYIVGWIAEYFFNQAETISEKTNHKYKTIEWIVDHNVCNEDLHKSLWQQNVVMPGETGYRSNSYFLSRFNNVLICFIILYRFMVLMNIRLSYFEIIGTLAILLVVFYCIEYGSYEKRMAKDRAFLYEKISNQMHFSDGMHWKDLLEFQILENQRLKKIEKKYQNSRIRNIRWLELYEHIIVNDARSIYDTIANLEDGIYDTKTAIKEIKPKILSIENISIECVPILPNSRKFNPKDVELISYLTEKIPLMDGQIKNNESIKSYNGWIDLSDLDSILQSIKKYFSQYTNGSFICEIYMDGAKWLNLKFISSNINTQALSIIQKDITRVSQLWDDSKLIDYYNFPVSLAVAQSYMKDINGEMMMSLHKNKLNITLAFPNADNSLKDHARDVKCVPADLLKFLKKYTLRNKDYILVPNSEKIVLQTNTDLLTEILDNFAQYSTCRIEDDNVIFISVKKENENVCISLKFLCHFHCYPIKKEIQETLHYWRTREELMPEHTSLPLLMLKNKMEELSGSVDLSLDEDYFHCKLIFNG